MDINQLASEIRKWQGRVLIGFKDVNATDGVDSQGKVLASEESVVAAKRMLRALGIEVTYEFKKIPAIAANISADLVSEIRIIRILTIWSLLQVRGELLWPTLLSFRLPRHLLK